MEPTVPWEDQIEKAHEEKRATYLELVEACEAIGCKACCERIEVGCRAVSTQSSLALLAREGSHWEHE